jgi:hypothetical protein
MTMRPLAQAERDDLCERLGDEVMLRLDALVVAGYALHAVGVDDPAADPLRWCQIAGYLLDQRDDEDDDTAEADDGIVIALVDRDGDLWLPITDGGWTLPDGSTRCGSRAALDEYHGPLREVTA